MSRHSPHMGTRIGRGLALFTAWISLAASPPGQGTGKSGSEPRIVRQVDHILLVSPSATRIFDTLTGLGDFLTWHFMSGEGSFSMIRGRWMCQIPA